MWAQGLAVPAGVQEALLLEDEQLPACMRGFLLGSPKVYLAAMKSLGILASFFFLPYGRLYRLFISSF